MGPTTYKNNSSPVGNDHECCTARARCAAARVFMAVLGLVSFSCRPAPCLRVTVPCLWSCPEARTWPICPEPRAQRTERHKTAARSRGYHNILPVRYSVHVVRQNMHSLDVAVRACGTATPGLGYARSPVPAGRMAARDTRLQLQTKTRAHPRPSESETGRRSAPRRARGALRAGLKVP